MRRFFLFFLILIGLTGCTNPDNSVSTGSCTQIQPSYSLESIDFSKLTAACFVIDPGSPIISSGDFFTDSHWNDPHNLHIGENHVMYASSPTDPSINDAGIYRLLSSDGTNWELNPSSPMLTKTASGWSSKAVETPAVIYFNGQYHMFYTAYNTNISTQYRIGHATSCDGTSWVADSDYLLAPGSTRGGVVTDFDYNIVAEPGPVVFNGKLYLYFTAMGYHNDVDDIDSTPGSQVESIGVITSTDGSSWTSPQMAFRPDTGIYPRHDGVDNTFLGFSTPHAVVLDGKVVVFYDVINEKGGWRQVELNYSYSSDGLTSWTHSPTGIYSRTDFTWADEEVRAPSVYLEGTTLHFWFAGHSLIPAPYTLAIGHATCDLTP